MDIHEARLMETLETRATFINGHDSGIDLLEVLTIYFWPIFKAYVREYSHKIWPNIRYSTSILSFQYPEIPIDQMGCVYIYIMGYNIMGYKPLHNWG